MSHLHKICPKCSQPADLNAMRCLHCDHQFRTQYEPQQTQTVDTKNLAATLQNLTKSQRVTLFIVAFIVTVSIIWPFLDVFAHYEAGTTGLKLIETSVAYDGYSKYAVGAIQNTTNTTFGYVQVEINVYDSAGNQIGSTLANVNNLEPGSVWRYKAFVYESNADSCRVKKIFGY